MRATAVDVFSVVIGRPNVTNGAEYNRGANAVTYYTYSHLNIILLLCCGCLLLNSPWGNFDVGVIGFPF
jgi:hypothetical protein